MRQAVRPLAALGLALFLVIIVATRAPAAATITYGVVSWNPFHWVVMVGTAKGQFEKHGVKLDIPLTGSSGAAVQALIGGSLHMTTTSPGAAFLAQDKAPDMKQIIGIYESSPYTLVARPEIKKIEAVAEGDHAKLTTRIIEIPVLYNDPWTRETLMRFRDRHQAPAASNASAPNGLTPPAASS